MPTSTKSKKSKKTEPPVKIIRTDSAEDTQQESSAALIARTHRAFGLFPSALLLLGYGETEIIKSRSFTTSFTDASSTEVERKL